MKVYVRINKHYRATVRNINSMLEYLKTNPDQIGLGFGDTEVIKATDKEIKDLYDAINGLLVKTLVSEALSSEKNTGYPKFKSIDKLECLVSRLAKHKEQHDRLHSFWFQLYLNYHIHNTKEVSQAVLDASKGGLDYFDIKLSEKCLKAN